MNEEIIIHSHYGLLVAILTITLPLQVYAHANLETHSHLEDGSTEINSTATFQDNGTEIVQEVVDSDGNTISEELLLKLESSSEGNKVRDVEVPGFGSNSQDDFSGSGGDENDVEIDMTGYPFQLFDRELDGDGDGISNENEKAIGTDEANPDTDNDGYADGIEIVRQFNPTISSPGDKANYSNPSMHQDVQNDQYKIIGARLTDQTGQEILIVTGTAPANSLVAILVYSEQKVWITRADASGRFIYVSGDTLLGGRHDMYAVAASVDGAIHAASSAIVVERTDEGIVILEGMEPQNVDQEDKDDKLTLFDKIFKNRSGLLVTLIGVMVLVAIVVWMVIKFVRRKSSKVDNNIESDHDHLDGLMQK